ncbi:sugar-phosphatase [Ligilactobacillus sp. WILCCON 0076]|uniref:Sugar-phosphatase n=1 Tax=Ligilactobacillus ubinensis TaxID=2876789 RepID=A0A9X2JLL0_9LACO|nr:sugar-phosphatase [Ligilactobacillus ubinensis]MCP0887127.1 sugar-phosphatase [Ligilactobacillus ubinensis]
MISIKLVAIDIDGTLVNSAKKLTPAVKTAIAAAKKLGVKVVICSGRPFSGVKPLLKELDLDNQADQYVICFGGAMVQATDGKIIDLKGISYENYQDLELLARKKDLHFHAISQDKIFTANRDIGHYTVYESKLVNLEIFYRTPEELREEKLIKAMFIDDSEKLDYAMKDWAPFAKLEDEVVFTKSSPFYLEANAKGVNKAAAVDILAKQLHLKSAEIMAIGDENNDLSMIEYAGLGVAMGNAIDTVKAAADVQTSDNDHDGVAAAIKQYVLKAN